MESFDLFPISCIINGKFIAAHGGISPDLKTIDDIKLIDRFKEPPREGLFWLIFLFYVLIYFFLYLYI